MVPLDLILPLQPDARGREPDLNAFIELHNLVAAAEHVSDIGPADTARISRERGVDLSTAFRAERVGLYVRLFESAGRTAEALRSLGHLARTLALDVADVQAVHTAAFGSAVDEALADDCLSIDERLHLYALQQALGLDADDAGRTVEAKARERLLVTIARVLCDGSLSPDEAAEVATAVRALGVSLPADVARMLNRAASAWERTAPLPTLRVGIALERGETAHADAGPAQWWSLSDAALHAGISSDRLAGDTTARAVPRLPGAPRTGRVVLTNRRLVLADDRGSPMVIPVGRLQAILPFADGFVIRVERSPKRLVLAVGSAAATLAPLLLRARDGLTAGPPVRASRARWAPDRRSAPEEAGGGLLPGLNDWWRRTPDPPVEWGPSGTAEIAGGRLVLSSWKEIRRLRLSTLVGIECVGHVLTLAFRGAPGWHIAFEDAATAEAVRARLAARPT